MTAPRVADDDLTLPIAAVSTNVMRQMELAGVVCILTKIIEATHTDVVLGIPRQHADPICEALRRLIGRQSRMIVERELVPGDVSSIERLEVDGMKYDIAFLQELLEFRMSSSVIGEADDVDTIMQRLLELSEVRIDLSTPIYADTSGDAEGDDDYAER